MPGPRPTDPSHLIDSLVTIRSVPATMAKVRSVLADPRAPMNRLVEVIEQDPALAAGVLQLANSPAMGVKDRVTSVLLACTILGTRAVEQLAVQATVLNEFSDRSQPAGFDTTYLWRHSFETAAVARTLHPYVRRHLTLSAPEAHTCGLLHDVGKIILLQQQPHRYAEALAASRTSGGTLAQGERAIFGFTAADVAARLAARWNLGSEIEASLRREWDPQVHPEEWTHSSFIHVASSLAHGLHDEGVAWTPEPVPQAALDALGVVAEIRDATVDVVRRELASTA